MPCGRFMGGRQLKSAANEFCKRLRNFYEVKTMIEQTVERLQSQLQSLDRLLSWIRALVAGAFLLGAWASTLQLKVLYLDDRVSAIERDRERTRLEWQQWRESVSADMAATRNDVKWMRESWEGRR